MISSAGVPALLIATISSRVGGSGRAIRVDAHPAKSAINTNNNPNFNGFITTSNAS